jgi:phosphoribosylformylglycinamidine cyclo-ligase
MNTSFYDASKEDASAFAGRVCRESWKNSRFVKVESSGKHFRSGRSYVLKNIPFLTAEHRAFLKGNPGMFFPKGYSFVSGSDGVGTKVVLADAMQYYRSIARDLVAMSADDIARFGGLPLVYANVVDYNNLGGHNEKMAYAKLFEGLAEVASEQDVVLLTGESAGLGMCVGSPNPNATFPFNWSGTMNGIQHENLTITGKDVRAGDIIVALKQDGFRSNGISKVRAAFDSHYGPNYYSEAPEEDLEAALAPSVVYARAISELNGWYSGGERQVTMTSVSHLSGGSFVSKFLEAVLVPKGLSARLDSLYAIPEITRKCATWLLEGGDKMSLETMYNTWCNGQGMLVTVRTAEEADKVIETMARFGIEAKIAGRIEKTPKGESPRLSVKTEDLDGNPVNIQLA